MNKSYFGLLVLLQGIVFASEEERFSVRQDNVYNIKTQSRKIVAKKTEKAAELKDAYIIHGDGSDNTSLQKIFEPLAVSQMVELMKESVGEDGKSAADVILEKEAQKYANRTNEHKYGGLSLDLRFIHDEAGLKNW